MGTAVAHRERTGLGDPQGEAARSSELYDIVADPGEQVDLLATDAEVPIELRELIDAYAAGEGKSPWGVVPKTVELDEMRLNHLRALGYVEGR